MYVHFWILRNPEQASGVLFVRSYSLKTVVLGFVLFFSLNFAISGFVNNDGLLLFWQSLVIYYSLLYYKEEKFSYALKTALFVGLALLTKFSGILVLGGVGIVFLEKLYKNRDKKTFIEVFSISLLILIGILIWPLYQYFVSNINYDFVPPQEHLSIAKYSFFERFTPIKAIFYEDMFYSGYESNLWETLTKTALFGQWNFSYRGRDILNLIILFVYLYKAIILMVIFGFFFIVIKNRKDFITYFIVFLTFNIIGGLICFVIKHPYTCNQDFRYIAIFTLVMAMILGKTFMLLAKRIRNAGIVVISLFEALSLFIWWSVIW